MTAFLHHLTLGAPLFALILIGYLLMRFAGWPRTMAQHLTTFVFSVGLPAMLFRMMSDLSQLPPVDGRLLVAFFGGCLLVFLLGRLIAGKAFGLDGIGQSVFGVGCIFSNNIMLGLPLAKASLGDPAIPSVALVLLFNALILWTLVSLSVEWHRHGSLSLKGFRDTLKGVLRNPMPWAILLGALAGASGWAPWAPLGRAVQLLADAASPVALFTIGAVLARSQMQTGAPAAGTARAPNDVGLIVLLKLAVHPALVWALGAVAVRAGAWPAALLAPLVLTAALPAASNVSLLAERFGADNGRVARVILVSTALAFFSFSAAVALLR